MCMKCVESGSKVVVGLVDDDEHAAYALLSNKIRCGEQALRIDMIPDDEPSEKVSAYVKGAIDSLGQNRALMLAWFERVGKRLGYAGSPYALSYGDADRTMYAEVSYEGCRK